MKDRKAAYYIDNRADDVQFEALSSILTGQAGGGPFAVYASMLDDYVEPRKAHISFQGRGIRSHVKVDDYAEAWLEPIRNPITRKVHRAIIEIPGGFEANRMDQASTKRLVAGDGKFRFEYVGTYGSFSE